MTSEKCINTVFALFAVLYIQLTTTHYPSLKIIAGSYQYISVRNNILQGDCPENERSKIRTPDIKYRGTISACVFNSQLILF
jgi:hypothetical protein